MVRWVTPPKRVTSPTWGPPPPCKQGLNHWENTWKKKKIHAWQELLCIIMHNRHDWFARMTRGEMAVPSPCPPQLIDTCNKYWMRLYCSFFSSLLETCNQVVLVDSRAPTPAETEKRPTKSCSSCKIQALERLNLWLLFFLTAIPVFSDFTRFLCVQKLNITIKTTLFF